MVAVSLPAHERATRDQAMATAPPLFEPFGDLPAPADCKRLDLACADAPAEAPGAIPEGDDAIVLSASRF